MAPRSVLRAVYRAALRKCGAARLLLHAESALTPAPACAPACVPPHRSASHFDRHPALKARECGCVAAARPRGAAACVR
jgi:hypothetical protein